MQNWRQPQSSNIYSNSSVNDAGSGILSYLLNCLPDFLPVQRQRVMFSFSFSFVVCFALFLFFFPALNNIFVHVSQKNKNRIANDLVELFPAISLFIMSKFFMSGKLHFTVSEATRIKHFEHENHFLLIL